MLINTLSGSYGYGHPGVQKALACDANQSKPFRTGSRGGCFSGMQTPCKMVLVASLYQGRVKLKLHVHYAIEREALDGELSPIGC